MKPLQILAAISAFAMTVPASAADGVSFVSFDDAIIAILSRSTVVATQQASYGAVKAQNLPIRLAFAPSVSFDAKKTTNGGASLGIQYDTRQLEGVAQMNLFHWGADFKNWQAASSDEESQQSLIEDAYLRVQDGAVNTLVAFIQRQKEILVAQEIVKMREDSLSIAKQRSDGGYLPVQEMEKVSVDLANANARLADARTASYAATAALENQLGHARVATDWPWIDRLAARSGKTQGGGASASDDESALAKLLSGRPDWRAAQAKVDAEDSRLSRSWRLLAPSLEGQFSYGYYYTDLQGPAGQPGPYGGTQWQGVLSVSLPLFDRLSLYSNARAQAFTRSAAELALEQVRRDARSDWETARQTFVTALSSAQVRDKTLAVSRRLYQDNLARFKNGRISADDLVLEQTRLYDSELLAVQGWASVHLAYSAACRAQGFRLADCRL